MGYDYAERFNRLDTLEGMEKYISTRLMEIHNALSDRKLKDRIEIYKYTLREKEYPYGKNSAGEVIEEMIPYIRMAREMQDIMYDIEDFLYERAMEGYRRIYEELTGEKAPES